MKPTIEFKVLEKKDYRRFLEQILSFYVPKYKVPFTEVTVKNSTIVCLALDGGKIIGAVRAISDLTRHAEIVDLVVDENYRKQKIGIKLVQLILERLIKYKVKNIGLTTESNVNWLPSFYQKLGFKSLKNSIYLKYEK